MRSKIDESGISRASARLVGLCDKLASVHSCLWEQDSGISATSQRPQIGANGQCVRSDLPGTKKDCEVNEVGLEATTRIELVYTVLQTVA